MLNLPVLLASLALTIPFVYANESNMVNERIPVSRTELEAHWKVDCTDNWAQLEHLVETFTSSAHCAIPAAILAQLQLCVFIHNPPGEPTTTCRLYRSAYQSASEGNCEALTVSIRQSHNCQNYAPTR